MNTIFAEDTFVDFLGVEHKFTVAGVLKSFTVEDDVNVVQFVPTGGFAYDEEGDLIFDENDEPVDEAEISELCPLYKAISIGISICNPEDAKKYNEKRGKCQSEGRAEKYMERVVFFNKGGMASEEAVKFFVNQTVEAMKKTPGLFIKGYNGAEKKHREKSVTSAVASNN